MRLRSSHAFVAMLVSAVASSCGSEPEPVAVSEAEPTSAGVSSALEGIDCDAAPDHLACTGLYADRLVELAGGAVAARVTADTRPRAQRAANQARSLREQERELALKLVR